MEYTVKQLADLAGVTVRTLHWYDETGLLRPARTTQAGYRLYGPGEVDTLQTILFYRALGMPLAEIKTMLADPAFHRLEALRRHRDALEGERARLEALLATLDKTILQEEGKIRMTDKEKFEGFKQKLVEDNERQYGAEIRGSYGDETVDASNKKLLGLTRAQYDEMQALAAQINAALEAAVQAGADPAGEQGRRIAALHREWLGFTWPKYEKQAHRGLAQMYVADARFTAYYDGKVPGCAQFLCDAITAYTRGE